MDEWSRRVHNAFLFVYMQILIQTRTGTFGIRQQEHTEKDDARAVLACSRFLSKGLPDSILTPVTSSASQTRLIFKKKVR